MERSDERAGGPNGVAFPECRIEATDSRRMRGYAIVFNSLSQDLGGFKEIIAPEAMDRTLREAIDVMAYVNHDAGQVIGRLHNNTLEIKKDGRGLRVMIEIDPDVSYANDIFRVVKRGDVSKMSFGFRALEDEWSPDGTVRTVTDMRVSEVSIVSRPAYSQTDVQAAVRSLSEFQARGGLPIEWARKLQQQILAR